MEETFAFRTALQIHESNTPGRRQLIFQNMEPELNLGQPRTHRPAVGIDGES